MTVNYRGTLLDGTEFDSSYKRGQPASFPVGGVIHGWTEALEKMTVGSKWKLFIPSELAYGEQGNRGIPPNSTLIFEVELLDTKATPRAGRRPTAHQRHHQGAVGRGNEKRRENRDHQGGGRAENADQFGGQVTLRV